MAAESRPSSNIAFVCFRCHRTEIVAPWSYLLLYGCCARCDVELTRE